MAMFHSVSKFLGINILSISIFGITCAQNLADEQVKPLIPDWAARDAKMQLEKDLNIQKDLETERFYANRTKIQDLIAKDDGSQDLGDLAGYHRLQTTNIIFTIRNTKFNPKIGIGFHSDVVKAYFNNKNKDLNLGQVPVKGKFTILNLSIYGEPLVLYFDLNNEKIQQQKSSYERRGSKLLSGTHGFYYDDSTYDAIEMSYIDWPECPENFFRPNDYLVIPEIYVLDNIPSDIDNFISVTEQGEAKGY